MGTAVVLSARRSSVQPRGGAYKALKLWELWAPVGRAALYDAGISPHEVDAVLLGNGIYGGGNPARLCALAAGIPEDVAATTLDSQCCSGLESVLQAIALIESGQANVVVCGGAESYSQRPLRAHQAREDGGEITFYERPPFSPWPERDPDMAMANARLADAAGISPAQQSAYAVESHQKALDALTSGRFRHELVPVCEADPLRDGFSRALKLRVAERAPVLAHEGSGVITSATTSVEADGAAALVVANSELYGTGGLRLVAGARKGGASENPGIAPVAAAQAVLSRVGQMPEALHAVEVMEAYAAQAIACLQPFGFPPVALNRGGGSLARGHPIGASGAILMVRLFHELKTAPQGARGLAMIAAAGGLGTAALVERTV
ncbi:thiolase family protein [Pseudovibrio exalbescens]|uniref:thiolase family protein n=1 Tax=Pseudovibrio exalbescens TaxID=197461 RepID=UPI002366ECFC|nr:thiolase family protein [Pseudovibrio exalbescens]MDD7911705.1 thiolase family protein [Pseudovibrio exalbescens]